MNSDHDRDRLLGRALELRLKLAQEDEELQRYAPLSQSREHLMLDARSSIECLARTCELYADRPCFRERLPGSAAPPEMRTTTYAELWGRVEAVASGLHGERLVDTGSFVGICGFGSVDWVVADLACLYLAAVSVPIQTGASPAELRSILNETGISCVVCSLAQLELLASVLQDCPTVLCVVAMDIDDQDRSAFDAWALAQQALEEEHGADLLALRLSEVESRGRLSGLVPYVEPSRRAEPDPLMTLMYTSGSTGSPKGAMFPESVWSAYWRSPAFGRFPPAPHLSVNYMPLNHMAGRGGIIRSIREGGLMSFVSRSDMSTLFEDIRLARPTSLMLIPRAASMIYQVFQSEVVKRAAGRGLAPDDEPGRGRVAAEVMEEMRGSFLGDRLIYAVTGTAPTAPEVRDFIERCFEIPLYDGYGSTEAGPVTFEGQIMDEVVSAFKVVSVPELGYSTSDEPYPRGELCVKSRRLVPGYYKNPEATRDLFDEEGYLKMGDIVEQRGPREVVWIDRKKNVLKLAQGEFVSTTRLSELYAAGSPFILQIYIHGSSLRSYLLAVIVPDGSAVATALAHRGVAMDEASVKALIREELNRIAVEEQVKSYEVPRDFLIEPEPFTREKGLLTESNKPMRVRLKARYGDRLESLYEEIERRQLEDLQALEQGKGDVGAASVEERVRKAMEVTLGLRDIDVGEATQSFIQLGGDSLSSARLADLIRDLCGVDVPVGLLLDPTLRVSSVVRYVEERLSGQPSQREVTFERVHGAGAEIVRADDLRLDRFLGPEDFEAAAKASPATALPREARVTLLTGANGFLGRFLALTLLEKAARSGGKVVCVVRAPSDADALERLRGSYRGADPALAAQFQALSAGRLTVLQGDLMKPRLGLADEVYDRLCEEVDSIVHNGALVNHTFSYPQLFAPNVLGTVELMRLATRRRIKAFHFVSTVGVAGGIGRGEPIREDEDARSLWQERPIDSGYAVGYATSKWACEVLLRELSERLAVPVDVFRCSMILPHRAYLGEVNVSDFLTRLLLGVVLTGLAPRSFYTRDTNGAHFDGLPVDFVAESIASIASAPRPGFATYHVVNARWNDGVSLDTIVDWVASAGYPVARVEDHAAWIAAFRERLLALSPALQQRSPLPILHQWARPIPDEAAVLFDARRLRARLEEIAGGPVEIPHVNEGFVHAYLDDLVALGLIEEPAAHAPSARVKGAA